MTFLDESQKSSLSSPASVKKQCRRGGMVDTADLKSVALKGVPVRVRPAVFFQLGFEKMPSKAFMPIGSLWDVKSEKKAKAP